MNSLRTKIPLAAAVLLAGAAASVALLASNSSAAGGGKTSEALRALATARSAAHGAPYDIESDRRGGAEVWELKVATGGASAAELTVSGDGHKVLNRRAHPNSKEARWVGSAKVGLARALRTADAAAAGAFDEAELDRERGRLVWSVTFGDDAGEAEAEIEVDAVSGRIVGHGSDD